MMLKLFICVFFFYLLDFCFDYFKCHFLLSDQKLEFVDVATGSLGQGLGAACGMAYTGKNFDKSRFVSVKYCNWYNNQ